MIKTKILIAEDDVLISEELKDILIRVDYDVVGIAEDYDAAVKIIEATPPDIALLDINMHGREQGFEIAQYINDVVAIPYLFISSYTDSKTLEKAGELTPASYITKPFSKEQVLTAIKIAIKTIKPKEHFFLIKDGYRESKVNVNHILWVKAEGVYIEIYTKEKMFTLRTSLTAFLKGYKIIHLTQAHRSYAINMIYVTSISNSFAHIKSQKIPISRLYKENVNQIFAKNVSTK
jgi:DNA-binding LytR/AlgR family response regulator